MGRINLGKPVVESKFREHEAGLRATGGEREAVLEVERVRRRIGAVSASDP